MHNSLPRRAAMTRHRLSRRTAATTRFSPEGIGCQKQTAPKFLPTSDQVGLYLASIHQMAAVVLPLPSAEAANSAPQISSHLYLRGHFEAGERGERERREGRKEGKRRR